MNVKYRGLVKALVVLSAGGILSGCFTFMLMKGAEGKLTEWKSDIITGMSLAQDSEGNKGYVFIGKTFDYLLSEGDDSDSIVRMLKDPRIDRRNIDVIDTVEFTIRHERKQFSGELTLSYRPKTEEERHAVLHYGFYCPSESCSKTLSELNGSIHKKNKKQDDPQGLVFHHPFTVAFYEYKPLIPHGVSGALAPVAITLDVVTSPLLLTGVELIDGLAYPK